MARKNYKYLASVYMGKTTEGIPGPFFFDPHTPPGNGEPSATLITGRPGSGKTYLMQLITCVSAILGKAVIVLDPKGDFLALKNLEDEIGKIRLWDISGKQTPAGLLDPFFMVQDREEKVSLALQLIEIFVDLSDQERNYLAPILTDVAKMKEKASLSQVVALLRSSEHEPAQLLGGKLKLLKDLPVSRLCFSSGMIQQQVNIAAEGLTIITMVNLQLPKNGEKPSGNQEKLSAGIFFLITKYIYDLMYNADATMPKLVIIDEAHIPISTDYGSKIIKDMSLLGRSKFLALILATQTTAHLKNLDISNTITTRFAFKTDAKDAVQIIHDMGLPEDDNDLISILTTFERGECLVQDWEKKCCTVQITDDRKDWLKAFANNPLDKLQNRKEQESLAKLQK